MKSKGSQFEQLQMMMPGDQLINRVTHSYDTGGGDSGTPDGSMEAMWGRKLAESKEPAFYQPTDVQWQGGRGVRVPVGEPVVNRTHGAGLHKSMSERGFDGKPISVSLQNEGTTAEGGPMDFRLLDGHHRAAVASDLGKEALLDYQDDDSFRYKRDHRIRGGDDHDVRIGSQKRGDDKRLAHAQQLLAKYDGV